ncbi:MAG: hypothetical protein AAF228_14025, partial [Pseudomonadota bacterium]
MSSLIDAFKGPTSSNEIHSESDNSIDVFSLENKKGASSTDDLHASVAELVDDGLLSKNTPENAIVPKNKAVRLGKYFNSKAVDSKIQQGELVVRVLSDGDEQYGLQMGQKVFWIEASVTDQSDAEKIAAEWGLNGDADVFSDDISNINELTLTTKTKLMTDVVLGNVEAPDAEDDTMPEISATGEQKKSNNLLTAEVKQPITGMFTNAEGDVSALKREDGSEVPLKANDQLIDVGDDIGMIRDNDGGVDIIATAENPIASVTRGANNSEKTFIGLATLAEESVRGARFEEVNPTNIVEDNIEEPDTFEDILAVDITIKTANEEKKQETEDKLKTDIAKYIKKEVQYPKKNEFETNAVQLLKDVSTVKDATETLRTANLTDDTDTITTAGRQLADTIISSSDNDFRSLSAPLVEFSAEMTRTVGYFIGQPETFTVSNNFDVTNDGTHELIELDRQELDYNYTVNGDDTSLKAKKLDFSLKTVPISQSSNEKSLDVKKESEDIGNYSSAVKQGPIEKISHDHEEVAESYFIEFNAEFAPIIEGVTTVGKLQPDDESNGGKYSVKPITVEITKEQYLEFSNNYGGQGALEGEDAEDAYVYLQQHQSNQLQQYNTVFTQDYASLGVNYLLDINGDGQLDRVQQHLDLSAVGGPPAYKSGFTVNIRDNAGNEIYAVEGYTLEEISAAVQLRPFLKLYVASHQDLIMTYGDSLDKKLVSVMHDFLKHGAARGITFDPVSLMLANPELLNAFENLEGVTDYYIQEGYYQQNLSFVVPNVEAIMLYDVLAGDNTQYLDRLGTLLPGLEDIYLDSNLEYITPEATVELTHALLTIAPQSAGSVLNALLFVKSSQADIYTPYQQINTKQNAYGSYGEMNQKADISLVLRKSSSGQLVLVDNKSNKIVWGDTKSTG